MLDFRVAQDSILVPNAGFSHFQLRKLGYKLACFEFNIVKLFTFPLCLTLLVNLTQHNIKVSLHCVA
jgi:hypothetical protein